MNSPEQLNGLVILHSNLQRIFVYDNVIARLGAGAAPQGGGDENWSGALDEVRAAIGSVDRDAGLTEAVQTRMLEILATVRAAMHARRATPDASPAQRLAAVAGDRYAGRHRNDGLVYWGDMFDADVADRFRQQIPFHMNAVNTISAYVAQATEGPALSDEDEARLAEWFAEVCAVAPGVDDDLVQTARLLVGERPE